MQGLDTKTILTTGAKQTGEDLAHYISILETRILAQEFADTVALNQAAIRKWEAHGKQYPIRAAVAQQNVTRCAQLIMTAEKQCLRFEALAETQSSEEMLALFEHHAELDREG